MFNQHKLPTITALRYFIAAAKHLNITQASEKLHVTQAAISKQVKQLEETLGVELFHREKQRIHLTAAGEIYYRDAIRVLRELEKLTNKIRTYYDDEINEIHVGILPTFASRFLIPLLPDLYEKHPEIRIKLTTELDKIDFSQQPYDLVISFNELVQDNVITFDLIDEALIAVASPKLISQNSVPLEVIEKTPLLTFLGRPNLWNDWFTSANRSAPPPRPGLSFESFQMLIHATIAGLGIALIPEFMISQDLKAGRLLQIHSRRIQSSSRYFMAIPNEKMQDEKIIKFREWLLNACNNK